MVSTRKLGEGKPINNSPGLVGQMDIAKKSGILNYTPVAVRLEPDFYCYGNQGNTQQGWYDDAHWAKYGSLKKPYDTFSKFCTAVKSRGGIVFTYFQSSMPSNDFAAAHPGWMLGNDVSLLHLDHAHHRPLVRYDFSDPGLQSYMLTMWKRLGKDGVQGIKFDYPETAWARFGGFEDKSYTTTSAYRKAFALSREGLGPKAFLHERNIGGVTHESTPRLDCTAGIVDLQRVWGDASHFEPEMASRIGLRWFKSGKAMRYYPDGKSFYKKGSKTPLSAKDRRTFLTLVGLLSGRIELGTSYGSMTKEMMHDLTRLYPMLPNGQAFRPVDMLLRDKHPAVYTYDVAPGWKQVILVNNDTKNVQTVSAPMSGDQADTGSLGLDAKSDYWVFDFWGQKPVGKISGKGKLSIALQPGEARVFSVRKALDRPQIIGTSRHIMCGMMELSDVKWDAKKMELSFTADLVKGEPLTVTIACPDGKQSWGCEDLIDSENPIGMGSVPPVQLSLAGSTSGRFGSYGFGSGKTERKNLVLRFTRATVGGKLFVSEGLMKYPVAIPSVKAAPVEAKPVVKAEKLPALPPEPTMELTSLEAKELTSALGGVHRNKAYKNTPLTTAGKVYKTGFGLHAPGRVVFAVPASAKRFVATVGLDQAEAPREDASIQFTLTLRKGKTVISKTISPIITHKVNPVWHFNVETKGATTMTLAVSTTPDGDKCDHANIVRAGFLK